MFWFNGETNEVNIILFNRFINRALRCHFTGNLKI